ncbi:chitin-binding lectin 1-like [Ischnura elegans]|uniref:chitin-binding lectin 1-like n=1 Tax=Ischnura elegans TaxID=197161 RepID=UPI001ED86CFC|nr:chitin-binding lectin 1-like [Ischnura elegans]
MGCSWFPYRYAVVSTVFYFWVFLSNECNGAEIMESCPPLEALRRCQLDSDCLQGGKCAEMNGTLSVCLASPHLRGAEGDLNGSSPEQGRCVLDEDCGRPSRLKCCRFPPHSSDGLCIDLLSHFASHRHTKRCAPRTTPRPFFFPMHLMPPSLPYFPMPHGPYVAPPPTLPYGPPSWPWHGPILPRPPPRPRPRWPPPPPTHPQTEVVCPPTISAAFRRIECQVDAHCGTAIDHKCCPTTAGGTICIPPIRAPITPNQYKPGNCPRNAGPWVCSNMCSLDRDCPGSRKCCAGRCPGSKMCFDPV